MNQVLLSEASMSYQPTSASAAAWRGFMLPSFQARIVGRDANQAFGQFAFILGQEIAEVIRQFRGIVRRQLNQCSFSVVAFSSGSVASPDFPISQMGRRIHYRSSARDANHRRRHEIPAHKRERDGMARLHARQLADRGAADKSRG